MVLKSAILEPLFGTGKAGANENGFIGSGLQSLIGSAKSGLSSTTGSADSGLSSIFSGIFHEGGTVGEGGPGRWVDSGVFAGATRYRQGGIAGLMPGEVPAILQQGEGVVSKEQMQNGGSGGGHTFNISIQTPNPASFTESQGQIASLLSQTVARGRGTYDEAPQPSRKIGGPSRFPRRYRSRQPPKGAKRDLHPRHRGFRLRLDVWRRCRREIAPELAMRCPPVFAAVKVLSESFGQIPLNMHAKDEQGGSLGRVLQHPLADMLADIPNPHQTWFELRYYAQRSLCLHGNSFNFVVRDDRGDVAELWALRCDR